MSYGSTSVIVRRLEVYYTIHFLEATKNGDTDTRKHVREISKSR